MMKKVKGMVDGEVVLKYQVIPEDLDALVSVRTEEDIKHMIEEQDRHESSGAPLLRAFLFPWKPQQPQIQVPPPPPLSCEPYFLEQRYIDAINGIIRTSPRVTAACSACSSPKSTSPDAHTAESPSSSPFLSNAAVARVSNSMQRVRSSPSLTNLNQQHQQQQHDHTSHYNHHHHQYHHHPAAAAYPSPCRTPTPQDAHIGMGRPPTIMTESKAGFSYYYPAASRVHKVGGYVYQQEESVAAAAGPLNAHSHYMFERVHSVPRSRTPLKSIWD